MTRFANQRLVPQTPAEIKVGGEVVPIPRRNLTVRDAFEQAFVALGGVPALVEWASDPANRGEFYRLYARLLPVQLEGTGEDGAIKVEITRFTERSLFE